jgi:hypothetical protein
MSSKNWKVQTRLLVREGAPHQQTRNCQKNNQRENGKNWSRVPDGCLVPRPTGRLTVGRNITLTLTLTLTLTHIVHVPTALLPGDSPNVYWIASWVSGRASLDTVVRREISAPPPPGNWTQILSPSTLQPNHYTDWATPLVGGFLT